MRNTFFGGQYIYTFVHSVLILQKRSFLLIKFVLQMDEYYLLPLFVIFLLLNTMSSVHCNLAVNPKLQYRYLLEIVVYVALINCFPLTIKNTLI